MDAYVRFRALVAAITRVRVCLEDDRERCHALFMWCEKIFKDRNYIPRSKEQYAACVTH